jgi:hypothetical protein
LSRVTGIITAGRLSLSSDVRLHVWCGALPPGWSALDFCKAKANNLRMTAEQIKKAREKAPFKPFTIYLSDQRRFEIPHQDFVWIVPGGRTIGIADEHGAVEIVDLVHVTSLKLNGGGES